MKNFQKVFTHSNSTVPTTIISPVGSETVLSFGKVSNERKITTQETKGKSVRFSLIFLPFETKRVFIRRQIRVTLVTYNPICSKMEWQKLHECLALKGLICARLMLSGFFSDIS